MMYAKEYEVKYYEQNVKGNLKESALLNLLQDAATLSAESLGFGPSFVFPNNYAWVVLKYHVELYKELNNLSSLILKTEPRGTSKLYAYRDFELYSADNVLLGKVCSTWALIEMDSRRILPVQKILADYMPHFEKKETDLEYEKIDDITSVDFLKEFEVRFDDIDVNHHANNSDYVVWALESLPFEFRLEHAPKKIDIKFRKEIGLGGTVVSEAAMIQNDELITLHSIKRKSDNEELASLKIVWF